MTRAASPHAHELAERESDRVHVQLIWDPLGASGRLAAARQQEREAFRRYRALVAAARESLRNADEHFRASSDAIDGHIRAALAALASRGNFSRAWVAASSQDVRAVAEVRRREDADRHRALERLARARFAPRRNRTAAERAAARLSPVSQP